MKIISLGWGVQSFTLAAMVALGELEPVDAALHSDTTHERSGTYSFAEKWTPWLEERGVRVVTVSDARQAQKVFSGKNVPLYTLINEQGAVMMPAFSDSNKGMLRRQCTGRWKITPMRRWEAEELKRRGLKKSPGVIEQWIGITTDEATRMKPSDVKYITNRWPLIEKCMSRWDCKRWLEAHNLEIPVRSSCVFCPYHDTHTWQEIKADTNGDWQKAVEVDKAIRKARPPYDLFVHPARVPLAEVDLRTEQEKGQLSLWDDECEGICGV